MAKYLLFKLPIWLLVLNVKQKSCEYPMSFSQFGLSQLRAGTHPEIFKGEGLNFSKSNQYPIVVNAVIVKQGFTVIVTSLQHLFVPKPCNNDFESCWL